MPRRTTKLAEDRETFILCVFLKKYFQQNVPSYAVSHRLQDFSICPEMYNDETLLKYDLHEIHVHP